MNWQTDPVAKVCAALVLVVVAAVFVAIYFGVDGPSRRSREIEDLRNDLHWHVAMTDARLKAMAALIGKTATKEDERIRQFSEWEKFGVRRPWRSGTGTTEGPRE